MFGPEVDCFQEGIRSTETVLYSSDAGYRMQRNPKFPSLFVEALPWEILEPCDLNLESCRLDPETCILHPEKRAGTFVPARS
jgi:hypothetical protein